MANQDFRVKNGLQVGLGASVVGIVTAESFSGSAVGLTSVPSASLTGTISSERLSGTYDIDILGTVSGATISATTATVTEQLNVGAGNTGVFANSDGTLLVTGIATFKDRVIFDSTNSIQIPVGTEAEKDAVGTAVTGQIRYNTTNSQFEGFGPGNDWGSLGGVKDVDGDTYVKPESSPGSDEDALTFFTGGTERAVIDSDGKVGIGTTNPTKALDVVGYGTSNGIRVGDTHFFAFGDANKGTKGSPTFQNLNTNSDTVLRVLPNGTGKAQFEFFATDYFASAGIGTTTWNNLRIFANNNQGEIRIDTSAATEAGVAKSISIETNVSPGGETRPNQYQLYLDINGNIGLGTNTPSSTLDVDGTLNVSGVSTFQGNATFQSSVNLGDNDRLNFYTTNTTIYGSSDGLNIEASGNNDILIKSNSSGGNSGDIKLRTVQGGRIDVTGTGGVGIYHTDTAKKLETTGYGVTVTGGLNVSGISTFQDRVIFDSTNSIQIPVGTSTERDAVGTAVTGQIRYNTTLSSFEGYGPGGEWGTLGGVKDIDQDTYITAQKDLSVDDDALRFYTNGTEQVSIDSTGKVGIGSTQPTSTLDVDGTLNVSGVSTFSGDLTVGTATTGVVVRTDGTLNVSGVSTFQDNVAIGTSSTNTYLSFPTGSTISSADIIRAGTSALDYTLYALKSDDQHVIRQATVGNYTVSVGATNQFTVSNLDGWGTLGSVHPGGVQDSDTALIVRPDTSTELRYNYDKKFETTTDGFKVLNGTSETAVISGPQSIILDPSPDDVVAIVEGDISAAGVSTITGITTTNIVVGNLIQEVDGVISAGTTVTSVGASQVGISKTSLGSATNQEFTFANQTPTGIVRIKGDLYIDGTRTEINSTTLTVDDLNVVVASGATNALTADGAGLTVDGANAYLKYNYNAGTNETWELNKNVGIGTDNATAKLDVDGTLNVSGISTFQDNVVLTGVGKSLVVGPSNDQLSLEHDSIGSGLIRQNNHLYFLSPDFSFADYSGSDIAATISPTSGVTLNHGHNNPIFVTNSGGATLNGHINISGIPGTLNVSGVSTFSGNVNIGTAATTVDLPGLYLKGNSSITNFIQNPSISIGGTTTSKYYDTFLVDDPNVQYVRHWASGFDINFSVEDARQFVVSNTDGDSGIHDPGVVDGDIAFKIIPESSTELRYNKVKKLETTGYGVSVYGGANVSGISTFYGDVSLDGTSTKLYFDAPTSASGILSNPKIQIDTPTTGRYYNVLAVDATPVQYVRHLAADLDFNISVSNDRTFLISGGESATQTLNSPGVNDSDIAFKINPDGFTELRYNKSKKFETTGYGVSVTGGLDVSGKVGIGTTSPLVDLDVAGAIRQELHTPVMPVGLNNDIGVNWTKIEMGADLETIYSLVYCGNGIVLAGSGYGAGEGDVYRSTDYGQTFTKVEMGADVDAIYSLVYCGNGIVLAGSGIFAGEGDVYRSTDYGQTWTKIEMGAALDGIYSLVYCGNGIVLAGSGESPNEGDVYRSTDFGLTFTKVEMGASLNRISSLVYCGDGIVLAGSGYGNGDGDVYRSTDYGQTWTKIEMGADVDIIDSLVYCGNGIVLAGGGWANGEGEVYRSTDFGQTFTAVESQMELDGVDIIPSLVYCGNGIVLAGSGGSNGEGDVYKSIDFGLTWTKIEMGAGLNGIYSLGYCGNGIVLAGSGNGTNEGDIYRSDVGFSQASTIQGIYHEHLTGNIGIGTDNPIATLDVKGDLNVSGIATAQLFSGNGGSLTNVSAYDSYTSDRSTLATIADKISGIATYSEDQGFNYLGGNESYHGSSFFYGADIEASDDGKVMFVSSIPYTTGNQAACGVQIYERTSSNFNYVGFVTSLSHHTLGAGQTVGDLGTWFGPTLASNADGSIFAVGSPNSVINNSTGNEYGWYTNYSNWNNTHGYVSIFQKTGNKIEPLGIITAPPIDVGNSTDPSMFGHSVAFSADGTKLYVGAPGITTNAYGLLQNGSAQQGLVYAYNKVGTSYQQVGIITSQRDNSTIFIPSFGFGVVCSDDGDTIYVSGPRENIDNNYNSEGIVEVYSRTGNSFSHVGILTCGHDSTTDIIWSAGGFGINMDCSSDGNIVAIAAAPDYRSTETPPGGGGALFVFEKTGTNTFTKIVEEVFDRYSVSSNQVLELGKYDMRVNSDASTIIMSASEVTASGNDPGGYFVAFSRDGGNISRIGNFTPLTPQPAGATFDFMMFGTSLAIDSTGDNIFVGAPVHPLGNTANSLADKGSAYVFNVTRQIALHSNQVTGNIGIGTDNPTSSLDVNGTLNVSGITTVGKIVTDPTPLAGIATLAVFGESGENKKIVIETEGNSGNRLPYITNLPHGDSYNLFLSPSNGVTISSYDGVKTSLEALPDTSVKLYYNSSKKLETTNTGVTVTGGLNVSGISTIANDLYVSGTGSGIKFDAYNSNTTVAANYKLRIEGTNSHYTLYGVEGASSQYVKHKAENYDYNTSIDATKSFTVSNNNTVDAVPDNEIAFKITPDTSTELRYNYTKKLETTGYGVSVTGGLDVSGIATFSNDLIVGTATTGVVARTDGTLNVSGISTFSDVIITGAANSITFDPSTNGNQTFFIRGEGNGNATIENSSELYISSTYLYIQKPGGTTTMAEFIQDGAVKLNHNNITKLQTHDYGIDVTGRVETDTLNVSGIATFSNDLIVGTATTGVVARTDGTLNVTGVSTISVNSASDALRITQTGTGNALVVEDSANPDATAFIIDNEGKLGVGTDNPNGHGLSLFDTSLQITSGEGGGTFGGLTLSYESAFDAYYLLNWTKPLYIGGGDDVILQNNVNNVGIGSTIPTAKLDVNGSIAIKNHSIVSITTSHTASAGTPFTIDTFATSENDLAEYTIHVGYGNTIQAQKVLVMHDGTTAYSQEYAVMSQPSKIVSIEASIFGSNVLLRATPESGVSGITTYKIVRGGLV